MISDSELSLTTEDYDKAFTETSFLLHMFVEAIEAFMGKSTPALAVAAGRKMANNMPIHLVDNSPENALAELVRVFTIQQMDIEGNFVDGQAVISIDQCPIGSVCKNRGLELDGQTCQMFHYYLAGIMAELTGSPTRPKTVSTGEKCTINLSFSKVRRL